MKNKYATEKNSPRAAERCESFTAHSHNFHSQEHSPLAARPKTNKIFNQDAFSTLFAKSRKPFAPFPTKIVAIVNKNSSGIRGQLRSQIRVKSTQNSGAELARGKERVRKPRSGLIIMSHLDTPSATLLPSIIPRTSVGYSVPLSSGSNIPSARHIEVPMKRRLLAEKRSGSKSVLCRNVSDNGANLKRLVREKFSVFRCKKGSVPCCSQLDVMCEQKGRFRLNKSELKIQSREEPKVVLKKNNKSEIVSEPNEENKEPYLVTFSRLSDAFQVDAERRGTVDETTQSMSDSKANTKSVCDHT